MKNFKIKLAVFIGITLITFSANAQFRFICDASGNGDNIFIDQVIIEGTLSSPGDTEAPTAPTAPTSTSIKLST